MRDSNPDPKDKLAASKMERIWIQDRERGGSKDCLGTTHISFHDHGGLVEAIKSMVVGILGHRFSTPKGKVKGEDLFGRCSLAHRPAVKTEATT